MRHRRENSVILSAIHPLEDTIARSTHDRPRPLKGGRRKKLQVYLTRVPREPQTRENESGGPPARKRHLAVRRPAFYWAFRCVARSRYQRVNVVTIIGLNATSRSHVSRVRQVRVYRRDHLRRNHWRRFSAGTKTGPLQLMANPIPYSTEFQGTSRGHLTS